MIKVYYDLKLNRQLLQLLSKSGHVAKPTTAAKDKSVDIPKVKRQDN